MHWTRSDGDMCSKMDMYYISIGPVPLVPSMTHEDEDEDEGI